MRRLLGLAVLSVLCSSSVRAGAHLSQSPDARQVAGQGTALSHPVHSEAPPAPWRPVTVFGRVTKGHSPANTGAGWVSCPSIELRTIDGAMHWSGKEDDVGMFFFRDVPAWSTCVFEASADGFATHRQVFTVVPETGSTGRALDMVECKLRGIDAVRARVRVTTGTGRTLEEYCRVHPEVREHLRFEILATARSSKEEPRGEEWPLSDDSRHTQRLVYELDTSLPSSSARYLSLCVDGEVIDEREIGSAGPRTIELSIPEEVLLRSAVRARVRLVDAESGQAIAGAHVSVLPPGVFATAYAETDAEGSVEVPAGFLPGRRMLTVVARGRESLREEIVLPRASEVDLGTRELSLATKIAGTVLDMEGRPVPRLVIQALPLERFEAARKGRLELVAVTDASGGFLAQKLGRHSYVVRVDDSSWAREPIVVDARAGDVEGFEIRVSRGFDARFVLDEARRVALLRLFGRDTLPIAELPIVGQREVSVRLVPGEYTWRLESGTEEALEGAWTMPESDVRVPIPR